MHGHRTFANCKGQMFTIFAKPSHTHVLQKVMLSEWRDILFLIVVRVNNVITGTHISTLISLNSKTSKHSYPRHSEMEPSV